MDLGLVLHPMHSFLLGHELVVLEGASPIEGVPSLRPASTVDRLFARPEHPRTLHRKS